MSRLEVYSGGDGEVNVEEFLAAFKKYSVFAGRARRLEYWMFTLINMLIGLVPWVVWTLTMSPLFFALLIAYYLVMVLPSLAVSVRRLHDTNRSGGWLFIGLVPFAGGLFLLVLMCLEGTPGENRFGPDPKAV